MLNLVTGSVTRTTNIRVKMPDNIFRFLELARRQTPEDLRGEASLARSWSGYDSEESSPFDVTLSFPS